MSNLRPYQEDLLNDVRKAYRQGFHRPCLVLPCGGGKSCITAEVAKLATQKGNRVLFLVHRRELVDQIRQTFFNWGVDLSMCRVEMVQTACRRIKRMTPPDLIITDENHHCLAKSYRKIYDAFPDAQCLGVTATPTRLNGSGLGDVNDTLVIGVTAKWLIENHFLAPYDYYAPTVADMSGLHIKRGEYISAEIVSALDKAAIYGDVISHYKSLADGKKAICYCSSVKHSEEMAKRFCQAGIPAVHIDGKTDKYSRNRTIEKFRDGEIQILCNVDLISEGFDVPDDDRQWTLEPKKVKKKTVSEGLQIRQCPECFYTFHTAPVCPKCGFVFKMEHEQLEEKTDVKLEKVSGFTIDYQRPEDCSSFLELLNYARKHGYKSGWAWYQAKNRGLI